MDRFKIYKKIFAVAFAVAVVGAAGFYIYQREPVRTQKNPQTTSAFREARYYQPMSDQMVQCFLCPNRCIIGAGGWGFCKARKNIQGKLYSMVYGNIATSHLDPIEKKPFFHVLPGSKAYSIATTGCNMRCHFCQNWEISQAFPEEIPSQAATPEQVVTQAKASGAESIAFTYNEPVIAYEYVLDIAKLAKANGLKTLMISNGYITEEPLRELLKFMDAYKVDLKAFNEKFYQKLTGGHLENILHTMKIIQQSGVWLEIVTLLIPGENDSDEEIRALARWVKTNLGDSVPLHFSRFFPQYKLQNLPPTPSETMLRARKIALEEGLKFVYTGNVAVPEAEATYCPTSKKPAIIRRGHFVIENHLKNGACPDGEKIPGIWK